MTKNTDLKTAQAVQNALIETENKIELTSGVVLRGKQANPTVMIQVMADFERPRVPTFFDKKMGREMENPDDPAYLEALQSWRMEYANAMTNAMIVLGTELVSVPNGMPGPDSDIWLDEYRLLVKNTHPENTTWRYLTWVKFKAFADPVEDMKRIQEVVGALSGVRESAVKAAEDFPGRDKDGG